MIPSRAHGESSSPAAAKTVGKVGVDPEQQARDGRRHVRAREDVRELVRHDRLQLRPREPGEGTFGDADHTGALEVAEGEGVHAQRRHGDALDARRAARDAHLLDDVGEALVVAVVRIEGLAVHGPEEACPRPDARHVPVHDREDERGAEDHARVAPVEDQRKDLRVREHDEDREARS